MKIIKINIGLFREAIFICISNDVMQLSKYFNNINLKSYNDTHEGLALSYAQHKNGKYKRVIWLRKWNVSIFLHETYHIITYILKHHNISDDEVGANLLEYIYNKTLNDIKRINK